MLTVTNHKRKLFVPLTQCSLQTIPYLVQELFLWITLSIFAIFFHVNASPLKRSKVSRTKERIKRYWNMKKHNVNLSGIKFPWKLLEIYWMHVQKTVNLWEVENCTSVCRVLIKIMLNLMWFRGKQVKITILKWSCLMNVIAGSYLHF